ncbi:MAG TPA: alpha/beta hydrolase [Bryobacteraceae bacterium]|nr:alpha/beta hydrolase [Bryobacteraceae bacterium]
MRNTVVFIHGAWVTPRCWRYFAPLFAERGYRILSPAWPYKDGAPAGQLAAPDARLAHVGIPEIVAHYQAIIAREDEPPVLIGHSFGGLIVQLLLDRGAGHAGIAISSVPPRGVSLAHSPRTALRQLWRLFGAPSRWGRILPPPVQSRDERAVREAQGLRLYLVPESRKIFRQLRTRAAEVDYGNPRRAPLLLCACGKDNCVPAAAQELNWKRYAVSPARTDFALFPELTHLGIAEPGYEALAAYCLAWADDRLRPARAQRGEERSVATMANEWRLS